MATYWRKPAYPESDRDPITREILAHAVPPGIYCEDEAAFRALQRGARTRSRPILATAGGGWELYGERIFVATPAQAEFFRSVAAPAPSAPEPDTSLEEVVAKINSLVGVQPTGLTVPVPAAAPPPRPKPRGPSRAMRRAAASKSKARRRA